MTAKGTFTVPGIADLVKQGEGSVLEFKRSTGELKEAMQTLCAFLNGAGGTVLVGVWPSGRIEGQDVSDQTLHDIAQASGRFEPAAHLAIQRVRLTSGKEVVALTVKDGAGIRAINELKPVMGLELTATPFVETSKGAVAFKNVIYDYPLAKAMQDGFVKEPAVVTQKNFDPKQFTPDQIELIKLEDGVRIHENTKVELETYGRQTGQPVVKPFMLIIARDTTHAGQLMQLIKSEKFFEGRYKDKIIQVDSSQTGAEEDGMIERLLKVESPDEPTEIVVHVNMLKEGWDVTNLYTIVPLRAANARILIEQSIGRGLRLPFGKRTGVSAVDRLSIVAHDRFQEIVDEANRPDSAIRLQQVILDPSTDLRGSRTVVSKPNLGDQIAGIPAESVPGAPPVTPEPPLFANDAEMKVAQVTVEVIKKHENLAGSKLLLTPEVQKQIAAEVSATVAPVQHDLPGVTEPPDIAAVVAKTADLIVKQTIDIPRILVVPKGQVTTGFHSFTVDCSGIHYQPVERDLLIQHLRTHAQETLTFGGNVQQELRDEDYIVRGLVDFDDISYDEHADLLYDLAGQMVAHLRSYLSEDERKLAVILDREALKWMKPANGQFQIFYKAGIDQREYVPDFVAETATGIYMLEPKARNEMEDTEVLAKRDSAVTYCSRASQHSAATGGKPWKYLLIPHDEIAENMTLAGLASRFAVLS